jgi:hypothetical protein
LSNLVRKNRILEAGYRGGTEVDGGDMDDLTEIEQQLLRAATLLEMGPTLDLNRANTAKIVNQVLRWRGLSEEEVARGWRDLDCDREHGLVYFTLVRMTGQLQLDGDFRPPERPGPALFEGGGNWGVPGDPNEHACWPQYNSCRLTPDGERLGRQLLNRSAGIG